MSKEEKQVVAFRIGKGLLKKLDGLANAEQRARGNQLEVSLMKMISTLGSLEKMVDHLVRVMNAAEKQGQGPGSPELEYYRGQLQATKMAYGMIAGERERQEMLDRVRKATGSPIPHIVPMAPDGNRYGFDTDAG